MAKSRPPLNPWPLLPRADGMPGPRPADEPARAAITAGVGVAALLLLLRHMYDPLAQEVARLLAMIGFKGGLAIAASLLALMFGAALVSPMRLPRPLRAAGLLAFDRGLHLALVLTAAGVVGVLVLHGVVTRVASIFSIVALALMAAHRARLHFVPPEAAR
jgi:hypothetical protein